MIWRYIHVPLYAHIHARARVHTHTVADAQLKHNGPPYPMPKPTDNRFLRLHAFANWRGERDHDNGVHFPVIARVLCVARCDTVH